MVSQPRVFAGLLMLFALFAFAPSADAFEYWINESSFVYADTFYTDPYSPQVACDNYGDTCLLLVYENNPLAVQGVKVLFSTDFFATSSTVTTITDDYSSEVTYRTHYNMPFDVVYNNNLDKYFIVSENTIYTYTPSTGVFATNRTITYDCNPNPAVNYPEFLGILNETHGFAICVDPSLSKEGKMIYNLIDGSFFYYTNSTISGLVDDIDVMRGFVTQIGTTPKYDYYYKDAGGDEQTTAGDNINYPSDYLGLHHWTGNQLYYSRAVNVTGNISAGIWSSASTDLVSFSTPALKYALDTSIAETINESSTFTSGQKQLAVWARYSNSTGNGIYLTTEDNNRFRFQTHAIKKDGSLEYDVPVLIYLACDEDSTSGTTNDLGILDLYSTCESGINITLIVQDSSFYPHTYNQYNLNHLTSGEVPTIFQFFYVQDLDVSVYTYEAEEFGGDVIENVNVSIDDDYALSNADGIATVTIMPFASPTFDMTTLATNYQFDIDPQERYFTVRAEKSGYRNETFLNENFVEVNDDGTVTYLDTFLISMMVNGTYLEVHLWTNDFVELFPITESNLTVSGGNSTQWIYQGNVFNTSTATRFPAMFLFDNQVDPTNITMNLVYHGVSYPEKYVNTTIYEETEYDFILNISSNQIPCNSIDDCSSSQCIGSTHNKLLSCTAGYCEYETETCTSSFFCDDDVGCFDIYNGSSCTADNQCPDYCLDNYSMYMGFCSSLGKCVYKQRDCTQYCNTTLGICEEIKLCQDGQETQFKIWFIYGAEETTFKIYDDTATCDLDVADSSFCIPSQTIPKTLLAQYGVTINNVRFIQPSWKYVTTAQGTNVYYNFSAVSISCSDSCEIGYEFCDYGCDSESGQCIGSPNNLDSIIRTLIPQEFQWLLTATFLWALLCLIAGAILTYIPARISNHAQPTPEYGLASMFVLFIVGLFLGFVEPIIGLIIVIGLGLALGKMLSNLMGGK